MFYLRYIALQVLPKIVKNLFTFFFFSYHVPNSNVNEQFLCMFLTLMLINITQAQKICNIPDFDTNE